MPVTSLTAFHASVRLKKPIRHASYERKENQTLLIRCELADGSIGWGEGLPRTYVTGESIDSCWRHLQSTDFGALRTVSNPGDIIEQWSNFGLGQTEPDDKTAVRECFGNTVRCAVELALFDATCRSENLSLSQVIADLAVAKGIHRTSKSVDYSGAVMASQPMGQIRSAIKMKVFGFRQVKVKVGTEGISDADCLRRVRRIVGRSVDLRLDANEAWRPDQIVQKLEPLLKYHPSCLEQPVSHEDVAQLAEIIPSLSVPVMLDESLCCMADADRAIQGQWCDAFNVRLSKCGGILRSLDLVQRAKDAGLFCQLGCLVGESGILSAAGRHFATQVSGLRYVEGSFDRFLVKDPLTMEDLTFRYRGRGAALDGPGLGVTVDESAVQQRTCRQLELLK